MAIEPTEEQWKKFKELAEEMNKDKEKTCPHCGYCPHCGRRNHDFAPYYPAPYWPTPVWPYEPYRWTYVTSGGTSTTISLTS